MGRYDGFEEFVAAQGPALSRTAYFLTGDHGKAEELLQEALTRTAGRWRRISAQGTPGAYVRQVMVNQLRSSWRRRRLAVFPTADPPESAARNTRNSVSSAVTGELMFGEVLRRLAPRQRAVLYLRFHEDLTEAETADVLGCSVGTVKSQTHDALARLRNDAPASAYSGTEVAE